MQVKSLGQEGLLEEGTATHSRILDWKIPWTDEPGGLQSMVSQTLSRPVVCAKLLQSCQTLCYPMDS